MAEEKPDIASPPPAVAEKLDVPKPAPAPAFEADAFLNPKAQPETKRDATKAKVEVPPAPARPQVAKRGGVNFFTALMMSVLAAGGGAYLALFAQSRPDLVQKAGVGAFIPTPAPAALPATSNNADLAPLTMRVSALEGELLALQNKLGVASTPNVPAPSAPATLPDAQAPTGPVAPTPPLNTADVGVMKGELQGISGRVTAIETRLAALDPTGSGAAIIAGLQTDIAGLKGIIANLQQQAAAAPSPAVTFALINIAEAANRSGPFMVEFETLRAAMPNVAEVAALEPFARAGVPTKQALEERFAALGPAVATAVAADQKENGLVAWVRSLFADMVKVQPATDAAGTGSNAAIERAKLKLAEGDLNGSIEALGTISAPPALVTDWIASAKRRLELDSRISAVRGAAARAPAPAPAPQPPLITGQLPSVTKAPPPPAPLPVPAPKVQGQTP